ncbi:hypothetical protein [uncultured Rummeliibacillus sp.]|uniref:hypothetical protein n=1 Tax=uncultured Rummeliibacillus sp. TaxID=762292 RepID=UPI002622D507|nr:hypothetical protein [uncultured Rummeliibacillus sp.]
MSTLTGNVKRIPYSKKKSLYIEQEGKVIARECTFCNKMKPLKEFGFDKKAFAHARAICNECIPKKEASIPIKKKMIRDANKQSYLRKYRTTHKENTTHRVIRESRRRARQIGLPDTFNIKDYNKTMEFFSYKCALTGTDKDVELDHVIPLSIKKVGTVYGNMLPLTRELNKSKSNKNIFKWFEENSSEFSLNVKNFKKAIEFLATSNNMTPAEYKEFVFKCFDSQSP